MTIVEDSQKNWNLPEAQITTYKSRHHCHDLIETLQKMQKIGEIEKCDRKLCGRGQWTLASVYETFLPVCGR